MKEKRLNILILEDNPDDVELMVRELKKEGLDFEWKRVETEKDFKKILTEKPDIILSDFKLPSFDGMSAIKLQQQITPEIPLIIVSGTIGEELAVECLKAGATDCVLKDRLSRLAPVIKRAIKEAEACQKKEKAEKELIEREKKLVQKNEQLEMVIQGANLGWWDWDIPSGKEIYNEILPKNLGYKFSEIEPDIKWWEDKIHPDDLKQVSIDLQKHFNGKTEFYINKHRLKTRTGKWKWFFDHGKVVSRDKDSKPIRMIGTLRDIDYQQRAEEALRESEEKYRKLVESLEDVIISFSLDGTILYCSPNMKKFGGYDPEEEIGHHFSRYIADEQIKQELQELFQEIIKTKKPVSFEFLYKPKSKEPFYVEATATPNISQISNAIVSVLCIVRDITERKKAEEELSHSKTLLRDIMDLVPVFICAKNLDGRFILVNKKLTDFYGTTVEEMTDMLHADLCKDENELRAMLADDRVVIESGKPKFIPEETMKNPDGSITVLETYKIPFNAHGEPAVLIAAIDITKRKQAEEDLESALERATESDRLKSVFLSTMSHELRTPLNAVIGFSEMIADSELSEEETKEFANTILTSGDNLLSIINDIFDITLIETDKVEINKEKISINKMLESINSGFMKNDKILNNKINLILNKELDEESDIIHTDKTKFRQILINLIGNAFKFTHQGTIEFGYQVKKDNNTSFLQFYVKDTGIGIPENKQSIIFERFRQADDSNTRQYGGTGLGLAISEKLAELLGGKIWVESEEGKGSTFYFTLPFEPVVKITDIDTEKIEKFEYDWQGKTILVVDDFFLIYKFFESILKKTNAKLIWAQDGKEAISIFESNKEIDMVLMDIQLPDINGYEVTKQIKKINKAIPVIAQTAYALYGDREKALKAGCDDYITKPINKDELLRKMAKCLNA